MVFPGPYFRISIDRYLAILFGAALLFSSGCRKINPKDIQTGYPEEISEILQTTCAVAGCHTAQSAIGAGGLNLETWDNLFEGCRGGSPVVPYSPELSFLLYSINTDTNLGPVLAPTMPLNQASLSSEEYQLLWQWVAEGAPNAEGEEAFPPQPARRKWYVGHEDCDNVAVFDAESRQIMRIISVGDNPDYVEYISDIKVTPDGEDWFLVFGNTSDRIIRYNTLTDEIRSEISLGFYFWHTITFSPDSKLAFVTSRYWNKLAVVDLEMDTLVGTPASFSQSVIGPTVHPTRNEIYLVRHRNQGLYVLDYNASGVLSNLREVDLVQDHPYAGAAGISPQEIIFLPDGSKFFVTCWNSHEVRVYDGQSHTLLEVISMPDVPQKMVYSTSTNRLFVSCMDDLVTWAGEPLKRGSVVAIDAGNHQIEQTIYSGYQPHEMLVDETEGVLVVLNRNNEADGPASHHASTCGEKNGYVSLIDLHTLELVPDYKPEVLADPIGISGKW